MNTIWEKLNVHIVIIFSSASGLVHDSDRIHDSGRIHDSDRIHDDRLAASCLQFQWLLFELQQQMYLKNWRMLLRPHILPLTDCTKQWYQECQSHPTRDPYTSPTISNTHKLQTIPAMNTVISITPDDPSHANDAMHPRSNPPHDPPNEPARLEHAHVCLASIWALFSHHEIEITHQMSHQMSLLHIHSQPRIATNRWKIHDHKASLVHTSTNTHTKNRGHARPNVNIC